MNRTRQSHRRPYARTRRAPGAHHGAAARLAELAGRAPAPAVDPLEPRQLLFSLTITPDIVNPQTGVGTAVAHFGYLLPFFGDPELDLQPEPDEIVTEAFDDVLGGAAAVNVATGTQLADSLLILRHNILPANNFQFREEVVGEGDAARLFVRMDPGEFFSMSVGLGEGVAGATRGVRRFQFEALATPGSIQGLDLDNIRLTLFYGGQEVTSFTGAELGDLNIDNPGTGVGRFNITFNDPATGELRSFDEIRVSATGGPSEAFFVDNIEWDQPPGNFAELINSRVFGARLVLSGPVGASVQLLDLYGRDMRATIALGVGENAEIPLVDRDDNGVPEYNDGIGQLILSGFDERATITLFGGAIAPGIDLAADFNQNSPVGFYALTIVENLLGIYDEFEGAGFGYDITDDTVVGLPPGPGSVIVGSPFVRDNSSQAAYAPAQIFGGPLDFNRTDQGVFARGGQNVGSVFIHGVMHGSSRIEGFADRLAFGYMPGSMTVTGDLGEFVVGSDAGQWVNEVNSNVTKTTGQLFVERTLGEILVAGRSLLDVTVVGDLDSPATRPPRDVYQYFEREAVYGISLDQDEKATILATLGGGEFKAAEALVQRGSLFARTVLQGVAFGDSFFRNDTILSAEFVGSAGTSIEIHGETGAADPKNTAEDPSDVYAFVVDGSRPIYIEGADALGAGLLVRVMDGNGRTLAAQERNQANINTGAFSFRFDPNAPGVYYLVVTSTAIDGAVGSTESYILQLTGLAPVTFGAYRTGAGFATTGGATVNLLSGSLGAMRIGTAYVNGDGEETDPTEIFTPSANDLDEDMSLGAGSISVDNGSLYSLLVGSDVEGGTLDPVEIVVDRDLGEIIVGVSPLVAANPREGDFRNVTVEVGGRLGYVDIRGGLGIDQDVPNPAIPGVDVPESVNIRTGLTQSSGDVGFIRVGSHVGGDTFNLVTRPGSIVGGFIISQDVAFSDGEIFYGIAESMLDGVTFNLGPGSDLRFVDIPRIDTEATIDASVPLIINQAIEVVDDAGGRARIIVRGASALTGLTAGLLRTVAVDGSEGVAIGEIQLTLAPGLRLEIQGVEGGPDDIISIGKIQVLGGDDQSSIALLGNVQIDVHRIVQSAGTLLEIVNLTPGGDIVAIDVGGVSSQVLIQRGDLGRTQVPLWGPQLIGPFLGIGDGAAGGAPLVITGPLDNDFNGALDRPTNDAGFGVGNAYLSDIGSPFDGWLNGIVVRAGSLPTVNVGGAVGDVLVPAGDVGVVRANFQGAGQAGRFNGIFGTIYGNDVIDVRVGDGLLARADSPLSTTGIFANDDILNVIADQAGATISSSIVAGNLIVNDRAIAGGVDGVERIEVTSGLYFDVDISVAELSSYYVDVTGYNDPRYSGNLGLLTGRGTDLVRATITVLNVVNLQLNDGVWDASRVNTLNSVQRIEAAEFRNSTATGSDREFRESAIVVGGNLQRLRTTGAAGDILDTRIDVLGSVTDIIEARNLSRASVDVDNTITRLAAVNIRGSSITVGRLINLAASGAIRTSEISVSGPMESLAADIITATAINVTGPDGRLDRLTTRGLLQGSLLSTGPIGTIESTEGDIILDLTTQTSRGNIDIIEAARDLDLDTDISGQVNILRAGRHLGNLLDPSVILVRGNLQTVDVSGGALYSDVRIGQNLTGAVTIGAVSAKPGNFLVGQGSIIAFGRISNVTVNGDFDGSVISHSGGIGRVEINDGSFLAGNIIAAYDGDIATVRINRGHLLGDVHADNILYAIEVIADEAGVFGDIGVNPELSAFRSFDDRRNELPPGVGARSAIQGPTITAGRNIGTVFVSNGSVFETTFQAGQAIGTLDINGSFRNDGVTTGVANYIIAGNSVRRVDIAGEASDLLILAGAIDLGADGRAGGAGADADTIKAARVGMPGDGAAGVFIGGNARDVKVAAGVVAGADGLYNTDDDLHALGLSFVSNVQISGAVTNVSAHADTNVTAVTAGVSTGGGNTPVAGNALEPVLVPRNPDGTPQLDQLGQVINSGSTVQITHAGRTVTISFSGPGSLVWDADTGRLLPINTTTGSAITISSSNGSLAGFRIVSNDDASLGRLQIDASMLGDSSITIDGYLRELVINGEYAGSGSISVGNDIQLFSVQNLRTTGTVSALFVRNFNVAGAFGGAVPTTPGLLVAPTVTIFGAERVSVGGGLRGVFSADRDISVSFTVGGVMTRGFVRSGGSIGAFSAAEVRESFISALDAIGAVSVTGEVFDTSIVAGADLGRDGVFGGSGFAADRITSGSVGSVTIGGGFAQSDVVAGAHRGPDGFFGTTDDLVAGGRSNIASVTLGQAVVGSSKDSESYGVLATGTIGAVTAAGRPLTDQFNFRTEALDTRPAPVQVQQFDIIEDARAYTARLEFNQAMNAATLGDGLVVSEIRPGGITIRLEEGLDYDLEYDPESNTALVHFRREVTDRDLPAMTGVPGPGIYRFTLDPDVVKAQVVSAEIDGDGDGFAEPDDRYSEDNIVGDAGDKVSAGVVFVDDGRGGEKRIDFRGAADLDIVLDDNFVFDGLPDANKQFLIQGAIGDHPDNEAELFGFSGDFDVYKITLQAGQILRLGPSLGAAVDTERLLYSASGELQSPFGGGSQATALPTGFPLADIGVVRTGENFLINQTGQYYIVVGNDPDASGVAFDPGAVADFPPAPSRIGSYRFTLEVFDDGNTGFSAETDAGNGERIPNAPPPQAFWGPDGMPGTPDDIDEIQVGAFTFTLDSATGIVTGANGQGAVSQRFADGVQRQTIESDLGGGMIAGVPGEVTPDVDVFHLNNRLDIEAGTRLRVTVKLNDLGSDLGSRSVVGGLITQSFVGDVQFAVFDTAGSTGLGDAAVVVAPTDFAPTGRPSEIIASDGSTSYGYNDDGDFFVEFLAPTTTTYAVYLQGVFNSQYVLEVEQQSTKPAPSDFNGPDGIAGTPDDLTAIDIGRFRYTRAGGQVSGALIPISQNVFIEFNGGQIDWLEAGDLTTTLRAFNSRSLGFTGTIGGVPVDTFVKNTVIDNLNSIFQDAGYDVIFSRDPSQFEFQEFSTVFVADTNNPIAGFADNFFGDSQHVDVLNADRSDEAVVFAPSLAELGYNPSPQDVVDFTDSLTAAIGRRVGELLGLRTTGPAGPGGLVDIQSSSSVEQIPTAGGRYIIPGFARPISGPFDSLIDTDFYLGIQNSGSLLDKILGS